MKVARALVGVAVSVFFAWATLTRVDLAEVGTALGEATLPGLLAALVFSWLEIAARSWRWRFLLSPLGHVSLANSFAYTCVGYFAGTFLPLRLGDVARGYLAATALRLPRLATLGSIVTERLLDGFVILGVATALGLALLGSVPAAAPLVVGGSAGLAGGAFVVWAAARRRAGVFGLIPRRVRDLVSRLVSGSAGIRTARGLAVASGATLVAYACAVGATLAVAGSVGLRLDVAQAGLVIAWIGLSTAIPAAPGSIGTYEFVGVSVLTLLGQDPSASLAAVVLLHVIGTLPVALAGLGATWALHLRVWRLTSADAYPAESPADSAFAQEAN